MSSFNKVIVMGNLTRTPELRTTPGGTQVTDITLAVNDVFTDSSNQKQERVTFVEITVWGKQAETLCRWKKAGRPPAGRRPPAAGQVGGQADRPEPQQAEGDLHQLHLRRARRRR
ncbi:MAG: single-stranded DNA-binding protein [Planctomycetota bacterium]|nr:single-stranded DNA-binding protein [Planctomycetota bacterium]